MEENVSGPDLDDHMGIEAELSKPVPNDNESGIDELCEALISLDLDTMTPREALNWLFEIRQNLRMDKEN
jgi:hypothetical protein